MESEEKKELVTKPSADRGNTPTAGTEPQPQEDGPEDLPAPDEDWDSRVLCSDESCIGVIGPDGRCRECGKPAGPGFTPPGGGQPPGEEEPSEETHRQRFQPEEDIVDEELVVDDDEWQQRILCSDESCIGVIGPDGRCRECGRPYEPEPQS
jgi:hypothetical protein